MEMLSGEEIADAGLRQWRKLAQGLHARFLVEDFGRAARFVQALGEAGESLGHHPRVMIGPGHVDLELVSDDAVFRDGEGTEVVVQWVSRKDVELALRIEQIAAEHGLAADPGAVSMLELGLDSAHPGTIAPVWAILLTGDPEAQGRGTPGEEIRDAGRRVPHLWFDESEAEGATRQRFHLEVYVPPEVVEPRIAAAVAAGARIVDDSQSPGLTVLADQDGNHGVLCADVSAVARDRGPSR